jgi:hypothetical protein
VPSVKENIKIVVQSSRLFMIGFNSKWLAVIIPFLKTDHIGKRHPTAFSLITFILTKGGG